MADESKQNIRESKDLRIRRRLFPNSSELVFNTAEKGFIPVPILFRKLLKHLSPPQTRLLLYLQLRASKEGICYPTLEEIAHDLGLSSRKKLTPHLKALEEKKYVSTKTSEGKKFFLLHHPKIAVEHLLKTGAMNEEQLFELNELLRMLKQKPISPSPANMERKAPK